MVSIIWTLLWLLNSFSVKLDISGNTRYIFDNRAENMKPYFQNISHASRMTINLIEHLWTLQDVNNPFPIKWKSLKKCKHYSNITKNWNICLHENFNIIYKKINVQAKQPKRTSEVGTQKLKLFTNKKQQ